MDDGGWIRLIFWLVVIGAGIVQMFVKAFSSKNAPPVGRGRPTQRPIDEFLKDIRQEMEQAEGRAQRQGQPPAPPQEPALVGEPPPRRDRPADRGLQWEPVEPDRPREARRQARPQQARPQQARPQQARPQQARPRQARPADAPPAQARRRAKPTARPRPRLGRAAKRGSVIGFPVAQQGMEGEIPVKGLLHKWDDEGEKEKEDRGVKRQVYMPAKLLPGLTLREAILSQVILGPPKALEHRRRG